MGVIEAFGALCFGLVVGWISYRSIRRKTDGVSLGDISSVIGAVGGAAVTALFQSGAVFGMYCIGLALGFFLYLGTAMLIAQAKGDITAVDEWMGIDSGDARTRGD
jgi:zinc transporter ZupT